MRQTTLLENPLIASDHMLKVTALFYFQEALHKEQYEDCVELLRAARQYGARKQEIRKIIAAYVCKLKGAQMAEALQKNKWRPRF